MYSPFLGKSGDELCFLRARGRFKRVFDFAFRVRLLLATRSTLLGLVGRRWNWCRSAGARNIRTGVARLVANYPFPILLLTDVLLNLNRMLITIDVTLLFRNLMHMARTSGGQLWRSDRGGGLSLSGRGGCWI